MNKYLIDVLVDSEGEDGLHLARIIENTLNGFKIQFLVGTSINHEDRMEVFRFEKEISEISEDSVSGYYDTNDIEEAGYIKIEGVGYIRRGDYDDDYAPSDTDSGIDSESESLYESEYDEGEDQ